MYDPIKPIRTDFDHDQALAEIQDLWGAEPRTEAGDRLDVLLALVEAYERQQPRWEPADPVDLIRFQMTQRGLDTTDLVPAIGTPSRVSEILNRRRPLTLDMIRKLQDLLDIPSGALVRPYDLVPPRAGRGRPPKAA